MAKSQKKQSLAAGHQVVASNRLARRDYEILETIECGIELRGSEVKSLRESQVQLADSYARIDQGEMWLHGLHIGAYSHSGGFDSHLPLRPRKLLLHRAEIDSWRLRTHEEHLALVPLTIYFKDGKAKVELALARGRKAYDKRQAIAKRDAEFEARRSEARNTKYGAHA
jgi:SsrA-binding protein